MWKSLRNCQHSKPPNKDVLHQLMGSLTAVAILWNTQREFLQGLAFGEELLHHQTGKSLQCVETITPNLIPYWFWQCVGAYAHRFTRPPAIHSVHDSESLEFGWFSWRRNRRCWFFDRLLWVGWAFSHWLEVGFNSPLVLRNSPSIPDFAYPGDWLRETEGHDINHLSGLTLQQATEQQGNSVYTNWWEVFIMVVYYQFGCAVSQIRHRKCCAKIWYNFRKNFQSYPHLQVVKDN